MIGIDEVGRGCWAGPLLVVAARVTGELPSELTDSKKISRTKREKLMPVLDEVCIFGEGWVEPHEIDELGLSQAMRLGVARALKKINAMAEEDIIMDGHINFCDPLFSKVQCVIRADSLHPVVSAASVWAKVRRDEHMINQAAKFPGYGFDSHVGYGTKNHYEAMKKLGLCKLHRRSYKPVQAFI